MVSSLPTSKATKKIGANAGQTMHICVLMSVKPAFVSVHESALSRRDVFTTGNKAYDTFDLIKLTMGMLLRYAITDGSVANAIDRNKLELAININNMKYFPSLTDNYLYQALSVIPQYYWLVTCWTCRHEGNSKFI